MRRSLKQFEPKAVAQFELRMWQAYYGHHFFKLLYVLTQFLRSLFRFSHFEVMLPAYYATAAAVIFRVHKGKETEAHKAEIRKYLVRFYRYIAKRSIETFDYVHVAELELAWWFVDRYPDRYPMTREEAIAATMSALHGGSQEKFHEYARYRAEAMVLQDKFEYGETTKIDWKQISTLLRQSYASLEQAVQ